MISYIECVDLLSPNDYMIALVKQWVNVKEYSYLVHSNLIYLNRVGQYFDLISAFLLGVNCHRINDIYI